MSGHAQRRGWARRLRKSPHFITGVLMIAVALPVSFATSASAASTFGGFELDGNLTAAAALDWNSVPVQNPIAQPIRMDNIGAADVSTFIGSKEDNPDGWDTKSGSPGKDDIGPIYMWSHVDPTNNHQYLYFAFERATDVGSVNYVVELNQKDKTNVHGVEVPDRQTGDLRFNVTQTGNNPNLSPGEVERFSGGSYGSIVVPPGSFDSAVNLVPILPLVAGDQVAAANGGQIPAGQFAEFGFDLTSLIPAGQPCFLPPFNFLNARSRASDSGTAEVKDFIQPVPLNLPGSCFDLKITKSDGANPLGGATFSITPNPNTGVGPALVATDGGANDADGTANGVIEFANAVPLGAGNQYAVTETVAPTGYLLSTPATKNSADALSFHSDTVSFADSLGSVTFTKVDLATSTAQCCAHFTLTGTAGAALTASSINVIDNGAKDTDGTGGTITVTGLVTGTWQITETQAPAGFGIDTSTPTFTISDANPNPTLAAGTFKDPPPPVVDVGINKVESHNPNNVSVGDTLNYTLTVHNNGSGPAAAITVTDNIPATVTNPGVTVPAGSAWTCGISAPPPPRVLTCTLPAGLAAGTDADAITLTGTADDSALGAAPSTTGSISNTTTVAMAGDTVAANNTSTATTPVVAPDLRIIKEGNPDPATVGAPLVYTLHVRNVGAGPTTGPITVSDVLDSSLTPGVVSGTGWACSTAVQTVTCTMPGPLAANTDANDITINVTPTAAVAAPGVPNTGTVATAHDPNAANNSSTIHTVVKNTPASPAVAFVESCGPPQTITVNMSNVGGTDETFDIIKPDGTHENVVVPAHTAVATPVVRTYTLTGGNTVQVSAPDLVPSPQHDTFSLACAGPPPPPGSPNLTLSKSSVPPSGSTVKPGDTVTYTLAYANTGSAIANTVVSSDPLPAGVVFTSAANGGTYDAATNTVSWALNNVAAGASGTVSFVVTVAATVTQGQTITNVGQIAAAGVSPVSSNPVTVTVDIPVTPPTPTLAEVKKVNSTLANFDDTLTYTLTVTAGGTNQTGVVATDQVPDKTAYVPGSATCSTGCTASEAAGVVSWDIGNMAAGDSVTLTFQVTITRPSDNLSVSIPAETITNVGSVGSAQVDPVDSNQVQTQVVGVLGEKIVRPPQPKPQPSPLPFTGLPIPLLQTVVLGSMMIVVGLWLTRPRRRRPLA